MVRMGPAFKQGFGREFGGRRLPEASVLLGASGCLPALVGLAGS